MPAHFLLWLFMEICVLKQINIRSNSLRWQDKKAKLIKSWMQLQKHHVSWKNYSQWDQKIDQKKIFVISMAISNLVWTLKFKKISFSERVKKLKCRCFYIRVRTICLGTKCDRNTTPFNFFLIYIILHKWTILFKL